MTRSKRRRCLHSNAAMSLSAAILLVAALALPDEGNSAPAFHGSAVPAAGEALERCEELPTQPPDIEAHDSWSTWGGDQRNQRARAGEQTTLTASEVSALEVKWAYAVSEAELMRSQPVVAGDWLYLGGVDGVVRALDARRGCVLWNTDVEVAVPSPLPADARFPLPAALISGLALGETEGGDLKLFAGDRAARVHAFDPVTGELLWSREVSDHPFAHVSGAPTPYQGTLYVPVSSDEWGAAEDAEYECCTFQGKVVALEASSGDVLWEYHTIDDPPRETGRNEVGAMTWGPSGAAVWSAVTVDPHRGLLYVGSGQNYSHPSTQTSSAIHAINAETGERAWVFQGTEGDVWTVACVPDALREELGVSAANCPEDHGQNFDFGAAPILVPLPDEREILVAGQKSGMVYGLDPDRDGAVVWETQVGGGAIGFGVHFGMAVQGDLVVVPVTDREDLAEYMEYPLERRPGVVGLDAATGDVRWATPALEDSCDDRDGCHPGFSAPATVLPGVALVGALDGHLQAFSLEDGQRIWALDTARPFETINDVPGRGGAMSAAGPVVADDMVYVLSGYGAFAGDMPGNVLLALSVER